MNTKLTIPTMLTLARILMIPVLVAVFYLPWKWTSVASMLVFALASLTDWLDGWIARRYHQYSAFGAFLDPVADKLMVSTALFLIVQAHPTPWMACWAGVIVGREIAVSALREWMAELGKRSSVAVSWIGKWKTMIQMVSLTGLIWQYDIWMVWLSYVLLYVATVLTFWSMFQYMKAAWGDLTYHSRF